MAVSRGVAWFAALLLVGIGMLGAASLPPAGEIEARAAGLVVPLADGLRVAVEPVTDVLVNAGQLRALSDENARLRADVGRLEAELATLRERGQAAEAVAALEKAVGAETGGYVAASVRLRDPVATRQVLLIDRGARDGLAEGQPVLGPAATLVGVIASVTEGSARVRLLSDPESAVAAVLQRSREPGSLAGGAKGMRLDFVPAGTRVEGGDLVLSSPLGGGLPAGLPIGRVVSVEAEAQALFASIAVEPLTDYRRLEHVLVLTDLRASPVEGP